MRGRSIRVRSHEIGRMSTTDLQHLTGASDAEVDHAVLLEMLRNAENIEIVQDQDGNIDLDVGDGDGDGDADAGEENHEGAPVHSISEHGDSKMPAQDYDVITTLSTAAVNIGDDENPMGPMGAATSSSAGLESSSASASASLQPQQVRGHSIASGQVSSMDVAEA